MQIAFTVFIYEICIKLVHFLKVVNYWNHDISTQPVVENSVKAEILVAIDDERCEQCATTEVGTKSREPI